MSQSSGDIRILQISKHMDDRGNLSFIENGDGLPFEIARTFWTYDVPGGEIRGGHAYHRAKELIIALSGSFDVIVTNADGTTERHQLNRSYYGLYVPPLTWRHLENFSTNSTALTLSSEKFDAGDYIRDFDEYVTLSRL